MNKDPNIFLEHIKESIERIEDYTKNMSQEKFLNNTETQDAVIRRIEIIGEAAKNIPTHFKSKVSAIEWPEIAGMRNRLIHEYFGVDLNLVWETLKTDLPKLKTQVRKLLIDKSS